VTVAELLERARSAIGKNIIYEFGAGGMFPENPTPANFRNRCDCSGYVCWCLGTSRKTNDAFYLEYNGGWINTDAMVYDANESAGFFEKIETPRVGALVVYPSNKPSLKCGHVGIITEMSSEEGLTAIKKVIHCSSGNSRRGDAIAETPPDVFNKKSTIYAWYVNIV
jgi:hypothetical protein